MHIFSLKWILVLALIFSSSCYAKDFSGAWFKPELTINKSPICQELLDHVNSRWGMSKWSESPKNFIEALRYGTAEIQIGGKRIFVLHHTHNGCGGACEKYQILASTSEFPGRWDDREFYKRVTEISPPKAPFVSLLTQNRRDYFKYRADLNSEDLFKLNPDTSWTKVCSVPKQPNETQIESLGADYTELKELLDELTNYAHMMQGSSGGCGTSGALSRWHDDIVNNLASLYFNPKIDDGNAKSILEKSTNEDFEEDLKNLKYWAVGGMAEFEVFNQFVERLERSIDKLSKFYVNNFNWDETTSLKIATHSVKKAIASGFNFYSSDNSYSDNELILRKAILEKRPLDEIKKLGSGSAGSNKRSESILNIAVHYPEALKYFIESGVPVNDKNEFDKTTLMYAAQFNNFDSVRILLDAGAAVNSGTSIPKNNCGYTLSRSNMTALHYAARYSSEEIISSLLDAGASVFSAALDSSDRVEYPIDWLDKYENENLSDEQTESVKLKLALPSEDVRKKIAHKLNLEGEKQYSLKNYQKAFDKFKEASQVELKNIRVLNNLSVTALKLNKKGESLRASRSVIYAKNASDKEKASAYFNSGLACLGEGLYVFDGSWYCQRETGMDLFLKSYSLYPTKSRSNKIYSMFSEKEKKGGQYACMASGNEVKGIYVKGDRVHILHSKDALTNMDKLSKWADMKRDIKFSDSDLKFTGKIELRNGFYVSSYNGKYVSKIAVEGEGICTSLSTQFIPDGAKYVYVRPKGKAGRFDLVMDLKKGDEYVFVMVGYMDWNIVDSGSSKNVYIIFNGDVSASSNIKYTKFDFGKVVDRDSVNKNFSSRYGGKVYSYLTLDTNLGGAVITDELIEKSKLSSKQ